MHGSGGGAAGAGGGGLQRAVRGAGVCEHAVGVSRRRPADGRARPCPSQ